MVGSNVGGYGIALAPLISQWKRAEEICRGTGIFEVELAGLYLMSGDPKMASQSLGNVSPSDPEYVARAAALRVVAPFYAEYLRKEPRYQLAKTFSPAIARLVSNYGKYCFIHEDASDVYSKLGQFERAAAEAQAAVKCSSASWSGYRMLTITADRLGQYAEIVPYCREARARLKTLSYDPYFMLSCAKGFAYTGDRQTTENIFLILDARQPRAKQLPEYDEAVQFAARQLATH